jgi:hypothetical protein
MKKLMLGAALAASMFIAAPAAYAATTITLDPPAADGSIVGGYTESGISGPFAFEYTFDFPSAGTAAAFLSSIGVTASTNVNFTQVLFNNKALNIINGALDTAGMLSNGDLQTWLVSAGPQTLKVFGNSGGNGEFTIDVAFAPTAVPEPATWAMMIIGFGAAGAMVRNRRKLVPTVA